MTPKRRLRIKRALEDLSLRQWERDEERKRKRDEYAGRKAKREYSIKRMSRRGAN